MNKKEMSKFCEWAKNDDFLSKFISKERDTKLDDLSFKDAKDYVYKLAKYGVDCVESLKKRGKQAEIEFL